MNDVKQTILLVEDEATVSLVLSKALEAEGFNVLTAPDGAEGLRVAVEKHPDLILADLLLPKMSGMDMIRAIRKDAWGAHADIIILTNVSDVESLEDAMNQGTYYYIMKGDTSMADVVTKVKAQLKAHAPKAAA